MTTIEEESRKFREEVIAMEALGGNYPSIFSLHDVAMAIPKSVPDARDHGPYRHGCCRYNSNKHGEQVGMYSQEVANKYTGEIKKFIATVPLGFCGEVDVNDLSSDRNQRLCYDLPGFGDEWTKEVVEAKAQESFLKLQEMVVEYHERAV